eukprot:jgi/Mesvir1/27695/Mv07410-RA.1
MSRERTTRNLRVRYVAMIAVMIHRHRGHGPIRHLAGTRYLGNSRLTKKDCGHSFYPVAENKQRICGQPPAPSDVRTSLTARHTADLAAIQFRQEQKTGLSFPEQICRRDDFDCLDLKGLGVRSKRIVVKDLKVYAVGFYVDTQAVLNRLGPKYRGVAQDGIKESSFLAAALVADAGIAKGIRLVMCRNVSPSMIGGSLSKKMAQYMDGSPSSLAALAKFNSYFKPGSVDLSKGTAVTFAWTREGVLTTTIGQKEVGSIANAQLAKALFNIYLGDKPVCSEAKEDLKEELSRLISSRQ